MRKLRKSSIALCLLGASLATAGIAGNPHGGTSDSGSTTVLPCVYSDFLGGAPYPTGFGPVTEIAYPVTGEYITGRVFVQQGSYSGFWVGDAMAGSITKIQLYVDKKLIVTSDYTARKTSPLTWSSSGLGTHEFMIRTFTTNNDRTKTCYIDSAPEYPIVI